MTAERFGYYLPSTGALHGDPEYAAECVAAWYTHRDPKLPLHAVSGASMFTDGVARLIEVTSLRPLKCRVRDVAW